MKQMKKWNFSIKSVISFKTEGIGGFCVFFLVEEPELVCAIFRKKSESHSRFIFLQDYVFLLHFGSILKTEKMEIVKMYNNIKLYSKIMLYSSIKLYSSLCKFNHMHSPP